MPENTLYYGDNLEILRRYVKDESVDLIYLDPPFNSKRDYNMPFVDPSGKRRDAQIQAFKDTWYWDEDAVRTYKEIVERGGKISEVMQAFKLILDGSSMMAYLTMMCARLIELNRILKPTGSIYLHCDINASHYLKLLMDAIFGRENFRNEIEWKRTSSHNDSKKFPHIHDSILFYAREGYTWNPIFSTDINSLWTDIFPLSSRSVEKLDYPTQKPEKLLERIILASSNPTDTVLDPYCGCGTTLAASQRLNRHWIGIDNSPLAIEMTERRLQLAVGELRYA